MMKNCEQKLAAALDALQQIDNWARAYPLTVFPEPDLERAAELLAAGGITLDAVSASSMRYVLSGISAIVATALAEVT